MHGSEHYVSQLLEVLSADPGRVALWSDGTAATAGEFAASITGAARVLHGQGVDENGVVALLTVTNSAATLVTRYAANLLGACVVHLRGVNAADPRDELAADEQLRIVRDTGTTVLVADAENLARARTVCDRLDSPPTLVTWDAAAPDCPDLTRAAAGAATDGVPADGALADGVPADGIEPRAEGTAALTYTSGTTGRPKGIARGFGGMEFFVARARQSAEPSTMLVTTPLSHSVSSTVDDVVAAGGTVILHQGFDAGAVLRAVEQHRVTRLYLAAPQLYALLDHPDLAGTDHSSLSDLYYGGCPASPDRLAQAVEVFGPVLAQIYGTTESSVIAALDKEEHLKPELLGTVGRPMPFVQVSIRDPEDGRELPAGENGEIVVNSPMVMDGYWNEPDLTARTLTDGWMRTGDIGHLDADGYLHLVDRMAGVVKTGGIKVYPAEVENVLLRRDDVAQAAVFGATGDDAVEHVHAVVVPRAGADVDPDRLRADVSRALSPSHAPDRVELRGELPLTDAGKPDKLRLQAAAEASLRAGDPGRRARKGSGEAQE